MALTQDEAVIVGCIVAFTVILIFGLVLWYFSYKSKLAKRRDYDKLNRSPITSDMPKQRIDIKFETSLIHQQSINQTEQQNLLTTTDNRTEQTNIIYCEAEEVNANPIEQNTKQITIDNTGIVLVNTEYKLDVAQADDEQFQIIESMNINANANSNTSDENGSNSQPHDAYENVANVDENVDENNNAIAIAVKTQSKSDIIAENENTFFDDELNEEKVNIAMVQQHFVEKENDTNDRTDNMDDFEVNVKEKKRNILDGGVQDRSETAMGRHKSIKKLKSAKVVKGQRRKFEEMIKQNAGNKAIDAARTEQTEINKTKCIEAESAEMEQYDDTFEANISDANVKKDVEEFRSVEDEYKERDEFEQIIKEENAGNPDMEQKDEEMRNNVDVQNGDSCTTKMEQNDIDAETKQYDDDFEANAYVDDEDEYKQELNGNGYGYDVHRDIVRAVAMDKKSTTMKLNSLLLSTTRSTKLIVGGDSNVDVLAELCEDD